MRSSAPTNGFTLIELMIVVTIIAFLTVMVIPNIRNLRDDQNLRNISAEMQSNFRVAQNNATSGVKCPSNDRHPQSWKVVINNASQYTIQPECTDGSMQPIKQFTFPTQDVVVKKISDGDVNPTSGDVNTVNNCTTFDGTEVKFSNILGKVTFTYPSPICDDRKDALVITLGPLSNSSICDMQLIVEKSGRMSLKKLRGASCS